MAAPSEVFTKNIVCAGGLPAFIAAPLGDGKAPVIVLMHERYGFVQHTRDLAERFAREGFVCIAPDCFFKHPDQDALHKGDVGYDLTDPESVEYLSAAIDAIAGVKQADTAKIAVMGVCQTGRHPLVLAAERRIGAALIWYGAASQREWAVNQKYTKPLEEIIAKIDCPVLAMFGEADYIISVDDVRQFRDCLERHGKSYTIQIHGGAPHGWLNDTMPGRYRREQAEAGWAVQRAFLSEVFGAGYDRSWRIQSYTASIASDYDFTKNVRLE